MTVKALLQYFFKSWAVLSVVALTGVIFLSLLWKGKETVIQMRDVNAQTFADKLHRHVLAISEGIGERHYEQPESLEKTAQYIEQAFDNCGLELSFQSYGRLPFRNVVAEITGTTTPNDIIIVGAHYDTVWLSPGADDNASGVAALLELACLLAKDRHDRTLRFVAFANEEQPFADTEDMGSQVYVQSLRAQEENVMAMYSLEMLGYYSDKPNSQNYPAPLRWFYPDTASFVAFVSNVRSSLLLLKSIRRFRHHSNIHAEGLIMPERLMPDIRRSDHASFWDAGYPALMVTDTSFYRNSNYHTVGDVARTLDYTKMAAVVAGLRGMLAEGARH